MGRGVIFQMTDTLPVPSGIKYLYGQNMALRINAIENPRIRDGVQAYVMRLGKHALEQWTDGKLTERDLKVCRGEKQWRTVKGYHDLMVEIGALIPLGRGPFRYALGGFFEDGNRTNAERHAYLQRNRFNQASRRAAFGARGCAPNAAVELRSAQAVDSDSPEKTGTSDLVSPGDKVIQPFVKGSIVGSTEPAVEADDLDDEVDVYPLSTPGAGEADDLNEEDVDVYPLSTPGEAMAPATFLADPGDPEPSRGDGNWIHWRARGVARWEAANPSPPATTPELQESGPKLKPARRVAQGARPRRDAPPPLAFTDAPATVAQVANLLEQRGLGGAGILPISLVKHKPTVGMLGLALDDALRTKHLMRTTFPRYLGGIVRRMARRHYGGEVAA